LLGDEKNLKKLKVALLDKFKENPAAFFKTYVMPLIPKNIKLNIPRHNWPSPNTK